MLLVLSVPLLYFFSLRCGRVTGYGRSVRCNLGQDGSEICVDVRGLQQIQWIAGLDPTVRRVVAAIDMQSVQF